MNNAQKREFNVRRLQDTEEDAFFAARMVNAASGGIFAYALPRLKLPELLKFMSADYKKQPKEFYEGCFVIQSGKEKAGFLQLGFSDTKMTVSLVDTVKCLGLRGTLSLLTGVFLLNYKIEPDTTFIYAIAVEENHRRKGFGRALLQKADEEAVARNCTRLRLIMETGNKKAKSMYERHGYVAVKQNITQFGLLKYIFNIDSFVLYEKLLRK